jgi:NAD(P)-dependent dehydrogenase (short-subunit alcohol dehydrogenase family)
MDRLRGLVMALTGKTVLITGGAGGLGSALAVQCAKAGADLVLLDKNRHGLGQLSDRITGLGLPAPGLYPMDLAGAGVDDFNDMAETIVSEFGGLYGLVHCAADFDGLQPLEQINPQDWLRSMQVNDNAPWLLSCTCLPLLKKSGNGRLFFLLDDMEVVSDAYWGAYGAGKAALTGLVRQFDAALSHTGITVRGIIPGAMRTPLRAKTYHAENPLDQPDPAVVAEKITAMLGADITDSGTITDLSR